MAEGIQNYKNHTRLLPAFHFFVLPVLFLNILNAARYLWRTPNPGTGFELVVAAALLTLGLLSRVQAVTVQDRVIRLEMRLRLRQLLPPDLQVHIQSLTLAQLIGLRFASDDELAELVREIVAGKLQTAKDIKLRVKNWQADFLRA